MKIYTILLTLGLIAPIYSMESNKNETSPISNQLVPAGSRGNMGDFEKYPDMLAALILAAITQPKDATIKEAELIKKTMLQKMSSLLCTCKYMNTEIKKLALSLVMNKPLHMHQYANTMLHQAVWRENYDACEFLTSLGATANIENNQKKTPLLFALMALAPIAIQNPNDAYSQPSIKLFSLMIKNASCKNLQNVYKKVRPIEKDLVKKLITENHVCNNNDCTFE